MFGEHLRTPFHSIRSYLFLCISKNKFLEDELRQDAIIRKLEIIGEATKNIPASFRNKHPKIEWNKIAGLRDKLIHNYFGINLERIWNIVKNDIPDLKKDIKIILEELKKEKADRNT